MAAGPTLLSTAPSHAHPHPAAHPSVATLPPLPLPPLAACSSEHPFAKGTPQNAWVRAQLAAVNRTRTPWVVVGLHRMPYVDSQDGQAPGSDQLVAQQLRAAYEGMWFDYSVDMVWYGEAVP